MGQHLHRRSRRWLLPVLAAFALLAVLPSAASAASSYDRLANISHTSLGGGGLGIRLGSIQIVKGVTLTGVQVRLNGTRVRFGAGLKLSCVAGGDITGSGAGDLNFTSARNWSITIAGKTGARGCLLARELGLGPNADVAVTLRAQNGILYVIADAKASLTTPLAGFKTIGVDAHLKLGGGAYLIDVEGALPGLTVKGAVASNGTYDLALTLDELRIGGAAIGVHGRLARTAATGGPRIELAASLGANIQIVPGLDFRAVAVSLDNDQLALSGTIRLACQRGWLDATVGGRIEDLRNIMLQVQGVASSCGFGAFIRLDGQALTGRLGIENGALLVDLAGAIDRLNLGVLPLTRSDSIGVTVDDIQARIAYVGNQLQLALAGKGTVAVKLSFLPRTIAVSAGVKGAFAIEFPSFALKRLSISITSFGIGSLPKSYQPLVQRALEQAVEDLATSA